jgi:hypothetical protein
VTLPVLVNLMALLRILIKTCRSRFRQRELLSAVGGWVGKSR